MGRTQVMTFDEQEMANRRPVWHALSELFLDTELQDNDLSRIARIVAASPYKLAELEAILFDEVYPVCIPNMKSVAGEWEGFDYECLEEVILNNIKRRFSFFRHIQPYRWMIRDDWGRVKELYSEHCEEEPK